MPLKLIDPSEDQRWDDFVRNHRCGSLYQLSSYKEVIAQTFKQAIPKYLIYEEGGEIKAGIPFFLIKSWLMGTKLVSLPFSSFSDPLVDSEEQFNVIFEKALSILKENKGDLIEFRMLQNGKMMNNHNILRKEEAFKYHILRISDDPESMMKSFHKKCIQDRIKKAIKSNIIVYRGQSEEDLKDFYEVLIHNRKHLGLPPQPFLFFKNLMKFLSKEGIFYLLLARWNDRVIAGSILLKFNNTIIIDYAAQNRNFVSVSPSLRLFWETILMAFKEGYNYVDFGKSDSGNIGLITFKRRWGCQEYDLPYCYYSNNGQSVRVKEESFKYRLANKFFKYAPLWVGGIAGRFLYRHID